MSMIRQLLFGLLSIATVLGVCAAASAAPSVSANGAGNVAGGADASSQLNDLHSKVNDGLARVEGAAGNGVDATGSASGSLDATTSQAGVHATGAGSATISQKIGDAFAKVHDLVDRVFGLGGNAAASGDASGTASVSASQDGVSADGRAAGDGSFFGKLGAALGGLFHVSG